MTKKSDKREGTCPPGSPFRQAPEGSTPWGQARRRRRASSTAPSATGARRVGLAELCAAGPASRVRSFHAAQRWRGPIALPAARSSEAVPARPEKGEFDDHRRRRSGRSSAMVASVYESAGQVIAPPLRVEFFPAKRDQAAPPDLGGNVAARPASTSGPRADARHRARSSNQIGRIDGQVPPEDGCPLSVGKVPNRGRSDRPAIVSISPRGRSWPIWRAPPPWRTH